MAVSYIYSFWLYLTFNIHSAFSFQKCNINKIRRIPKITSQFRNHTYIGFIMEEFHLKQHWFTHKLLQFHNIFSHPDHHRTRVKRTATHARWGQTIFWSHIEPAQDLGPIHLIFSSFGLWYLAKVWVFWEGHKIWKNLRHTFDKSIILVEKSTKIF